MAKQPNSLFIQKLPELYNAKALIIDLRYNGGGSTGIGTNIFKYLTNDKIIYGAKNTSRLHIPTFKAWGAFLTPNDTLKAKPEWGMTKEEITKCYQMAKDNYYYHFDYSGDTLKLNEKRVVIPTVLLQGHNTASAAEDFLIYADNQKHMTKIGENSFGSTGQPFLFDLPGGASARICTKKDTYPDGREFVGYGIKPDIEIKLTLADYLGKKDPIIVKAIEFLTDKLK
jgi:C-terminal processing protease CtpA/Prc